MAQPQPATPRGDKPSQDWWHLYASYRYAKAARDFAVFEPEGDDEDVEPLSRLQDAAFCEFMLTPAQTPAHLGLKLEVLRDENAAQPTDAILAVLALDGARLADAFPPDGDEQVRLDGATEET